MAEEFLLTTVLRDALTDLFSELFSDAAKVFLPVNAVLDTVVCDDSGSVNSVFTCIPFKHIKVHNTSC